MNQIKNLKKLNLPEYEFRFKNEEGKVFIFDDLRKKYVVLNQEEWVRQNFIRYLINVKKFPVSLMVVEKKVIINRQPQRFDLLIYNRKGLPHAIVEFKAPEIKITQKVFDQVVRYNMELRVEYIIVSNGLLHFVCKIDYINNNYLFIKEVPVFGE